MKKQIVVWLLAMVALPAWASLNVFATVPEWGALAKEIGGEQVTVYTAVSYTHLRAHETVLDIVCRLLLEQNNTI